MALPDPLRAVPRPPYPGLDPLARPAPMPVPAHWAHDLCGVGGQARILLGDQVYTLRITRAGKLILTK